MSCRSDDRDAVLRIVRRDDRWLWKARIRGLRLPDDLIEPVRVVMAEGGSGSEWQSRSCTHRQRRTVCR